MAIGPSVGAEEQEVDSSIQVSAIDQESIGLTESSTVVLAEESQEDEIITRNEDLLKDKEASQESVPSTRASIIYVNVYRLYNPNSGAHRYTLSSAERDSLRSYGWHSEGVAWLSPKTHGSPVYRVFNLHTGEHVYTTNYQEVRNVVRSGWNYEGVGFRAGTSSIPIHNLPVYRVFNPNARNAGSHHYTKNKQEATNLIRSGWRDEGEAFFC